MRKHMKEYITLIICFVIAFGILYCKVSASSLILHIPFNGNYIDNVSEIAITNYGNSEFVAGISGKAVYLDGDGDYLKLGTNYNLLGSFTFSVWVNSQSQDRGEAALLAKYETNNYGPYDFYLSYNKPAFWVSDGKGSYSKYISDTTLLSSQWYLLTYVYNKDEQKLTIYIDGEYDNSFESIDLTSNDDTVTIGRQELMFPPYTDLEYKGYLDDLRLYSSALSASEVVDLYNSYPKSYTVTFVNSDGVILKEQIVASGSSAIAPDAPIKAKTAKYTYKFKNWNKSYSNVTSDITVRAVYTKILNKYVLTFNSNSGSQTKKYTKTLDYGTKYGTLNKPIRKGYQFLGWYTKKIGGIKVSSKTICKGKRILYAHWKKK